MRCIERKAQSPSNWAYKTLGLSVIGSSLARASFLSKSHGRLEAGEDSNTAASSTSWVMLLSVLYIWFHWKISSHHVRFTLVFSSINELPFTLYLAALRNTDNEGIDKSSKKSKSGRRRPGGDKCFMFFLTQDVRARVPWTITSQPMLWSLIDFPHSLRTTLC
jgi:hypothetical protein